MIESITIITLIALLATCFAYYNLHKQQKEFTDYWYSEYKKLQSDYLGAIRSLLDCEEKIKN